MKITKINVYVEKGPVEIPGWRPVLCRVFTDEGIYGDGEAAIAYGKGASAAFGMIKDLAPMLIGMNPMHNEVIWNKLYKETCWGQAGGPIVFAGIAALDMACWDIKGKALGQSLCEMMGGPVHDKLRGYASQIHCGWGTDKPTHDHCFEREDYLVATQRCIDQGYTAVKVDVAQVSTERKGMSDELKLRSQMTETQMDIFEDRISAVREVLGPDRSLLLECHSQFDAPGAVRLAQRAEKYDIYFMEEPNTPSPVTAKYISNHVNIPIAQGERIYTRMQYIPYFNDQSLQIIQPDIGTCGGITETKKVCDMAYAYDIGVQIHACASPLHCAAALGMEAAMPHFCIHEHHINNTFKWNSRLVDMNYEPVDGYFPVPTRPGLGAEFTEFALTENVEQKATIE